MPTDYRVGSDTKSKSIDTFSAGCGVRVLSGFYESPTKLDDFLKAKVKDGVEKGSYGKAGNCAIWVLFITEGQHIVFSETLKNNGFRCVVNGAWNNIHGSMMYMWTRVNFPENSNPDVYEPDF